MNFVLWGLLTVFSFPLYAHDAKPVLKPQTPAALMGQACEGQLAGRDLELARRQWAGKVVIFDTNVLLNDPYAIYKFPGAQIIIPGTVLEEIDNNKSKENVAKAARAFARMMDGFLRSGGNLRAGLDIGQGSILKVDSRDETRLLSNTTLDRTKKDNEIIALALAYTMETPNYGDVVLISDDINVRVKAASEEVVAAPFEYEWVRPAKEIEHDYAVYEITQRDLDAFIANGRMKKPAGLNIRPNEFVMLQTESNGGGLETMARYVYDRDNPEQSGLRALKRIDGPIQPKNLEQAMLLDLALDPTVSLVVVEADAGTGKTFISSYALLQQLPGGAEARYGLGMISRPLVTMGNHNIGALPGNMVQKMSEDFNSYYDNLRQIRNQMSAKTEPKKDGKEKHGGKMSTPVQIPNLELLAFPFIRGRTLPNTMAIVDEFQNTTIHEAKTMLTRMGEGAKLMVLGNAAQIDLPYLNDRNNGLSVTASLFTQDSLSDEERSHVGFVRLREGVRSDLASLAIKLFSKPLPPQ